MSTALVIIDPQNDFMDTEEAALGVPGALSDMKRLCEFIDRNGQAIDEIIVTLDTHTPDHIAHPVRWVDTRTGEHPAPFTQVTAIDVENGTFHAADSAKQEWQQKYVHLLKEVGGKDLMIWPPHCIEGTAGHDIESGLLKQLKAWRQDNDKEIKIVRKGMHPDTEQYGAFAADVILKDVEATHLNVALVEHINAHKTVLWAGEALSHCVMASFDQAVLSAKKPSNHTILLDCTSPVAGFEEMVTPWLQSQRRRGSHTTESSVLSLV